VTFFIGVGRRNTVLDKPPGTLPICRAKNST
jgi:hypothetical protein